GFEASRALALRGVAGAFARVGENERAAEVAVQALAAAEMIEDTSTRAEALADVSRALTQAGQQEQALEVVQTAFTTARLVGRASLFTGLECAVSTLAAIDHGQTLWRVYEAVQEIESWWNDR